MRARRPLGQRIQIDVDARQDHPDDRRYHSNMDVYDRLIPEDLMANSVILATFVYHAAMRDEMMPRAPPRPW